MSDPFGSRAGAHGRPARAALLHEVFAAVAVRHPERVAIEVPPGRGRPQRRRWSYRALDAAAEEIAGRLGPHVAGECVVALLLPRETPWLFAAQLGVLRAGAAWTALDPGFPDEHARFLLEDAASVAVVTDASGRERALRLGVRPERIVVVGDGAPPPSSAPERAPAAPPPWLGPASLAYVIYTSGTTGRPKGVLVEHRSITNLVLSDVERFGLGPQDRVAQNSSAAYDSSIEESWLALAVGATLVVLDDETVRLGPDLGPWLAAERVTAFCPPPTLLRTMGCADPHVALPDLRFVYVGGEPLPEDVAAVWARDLWLENGYGPTEGTVTCLRTRVVPGRPVTIGSPIPGARAHVCDERLEEVPEGEVGELCLAGVCVARGYLGRPELTRERFPVHPRLGRLYRTGDLVRRDAAGEHHYLGRVDSQVKVRGHRIELSAVEAAICACPGVRAAACRVQGEGAAQVLAAHVVPRDPGAPPSAAALEAELRTRLPAPMVPSRWGSLPVLPTNRSGKLDRAALAVLGAVEGPTSRPRVAPRGGVEETIARVVERVLALGAPPSVEDDLFLVLGATSISAAGIVSALREDATTARLTVRDVYEARTIAGLAARAESAGPGEAASAGVPSPLARGRPALAGAVQAAWLAIALAASSGALYVGWFVLVPFLLGRLGVAGSLATLPVLFFAARLVWTPLAVLLLVGAKRVLVGRYRPMRAPAWGSFHVRHWIVRHVAGIVPWSLLADTSALGVVLRALGARVGRRVHLHRGTDLRNGGWDLLTLGDDVTVSQDASLRLVTLDGGELVVGPVTLRAGATLDVRAGVDGHAEMGEGSYLTALSWLPAGERVPAGECWDGVPARPRGAAPPPPRASRAAHDLPAPAFDGLALLLRFLRASLPYYATLFPLALLGASHYGLDAAGMAAWVERPFAASAPVLGLLGLVVVSGVLALLVSALGLRLLGRVRPGVLRRSSVAYLRVLAKTEALARAGNVLSGTLFWPVWLRLAGASIGRRCEISTIVDVVPECLGVGDETFLADGIYLGGPRLHRGLVSVAPTRLGRANFLGNHVVVPAGTRLPDDVLVGISTVASDGLVREGTDWFGHPAFELPRREVVAAPRDLTHEPGPVRFLTRLCWETGRFALPVVPVLLLLGWLEAVHRGLAIAVSPLARLAVLPAATLAAGAAACALVLALKWALLGRVRPGRHALWSCWCSRWDFLYVAWGAWARRPLGALEGTPFLPVYLRWMGCRIGKGTLLGSGFAQVVDPDMLTIEDGATVHALFQAHSFEDRVLKIDRVRIGRNATVGSQAVLLYGADVGDGTRVAPHGVVMKHERLGAGTAWAGCPTRPWRAAVRPVNAPRAPEPAPAR